VCVCVCVCMCVSKNEALKSDVPPTNHSEFYSIHLSFYLSLYMPPLAYMVAYTTTKYVYAASDV